MKKLIVVLAMIAGSVFLAAPAAVAEDTGTPPATDTTTTDAAPATDTTTTDAAPAPDPAPAPAPDAAAAAAPAAATTGQATKAASSKAPSVSAARPKADAPQDDPKVTICHRTNSNTNPYVQITPAASGVFNGHDGQHTGPVWNPTLKPNHIKWGDIIPPYTYDGTNYPGQNWTTEGQAIYQADCNIPAAPIPVTTEEPTATPPTCEAPGVLVLPTTEGVIYNSTPSGTGPGRYTVTATAAPGFVLTPDSVTSFEVTVLRQLHGPHCDGLIPVTTEEPTPTPPTCFDRGVLVLPTTEGVIYSSTPEGTGPGRYTVTATAAPGFVLTADSVTSFEVIVLRRLRGGDCPPKDPKVTICHRTNSNTNPYVQITPSAAGVHNGHDSKHNGPVWNPTLKDQKIRWGDIIPPYTFRGVEHPGKNFGPEGRAILANGCNIPVVVPVEVTPAITTEKNCDGGDVPSFVDVLGVEYEFTVGNGISGPYVITATALPGFVIADGAQTVFTGDAGDPDSCPGPKDDGDEPEDQPAARENELLPDTGGIPLWMLLLGGPMTAAGLMVLMRRRPVAYAYTGGSGPSYSLSLPPAAKPVAFMREVAPTRSFFKSLVTAVRSLFRGGRG